MASMLSVLSSGLAMLSASRRSTGSADASCSEAEGERGERRCPGRHAQRCHATCGATTRCPASDFPSSSLRHSCVHGARLSPALLAFVIACCGFSLTAESASRPPSQGQRNVLAGAYLHGDGAAFVGLPARGLDAGLAALLDAGARNAGACLKGSPFPRAIHLKANTVFGPALQCDTSAAGRHKRSAALSAHAGGFGRPALAVEQSGKACASKRSDEAQESCSPSSQLLGEAGALSAQERRMLRVLSRHGRVHGQAEAPSSKTVTKKGGVRTTGFANRSVREQGAEMAQDRREEKLALRRQGSVREKKDMECKGSGAAGGKGVRSKEHRKERRNFAVSRSKSKMKLDAKTYNAQRLDDKADTSPGAKRAVASTPGRSCITVEREEHSVREEREMIVTKDKPCRPKGSSTRVRAKHAAVRTNGKLFERELLSSPVHPCRIRSIPHNLANYTSLVVLLDVLEPFCEAKGYGRGCKPTGGCCSVDGTQLSASSVSDAVGALNRLKRLRNQATNQQLEMRLSGCMECLSVLVLDGMPLLSGKLVSLAINAVAHTRRHSRLISAAGKRAVQIAQSDEEAGTLDVQAVSVILNGFARAGMRDVHLFTTMSSVAIRLMENNSSDFGAQAISVMANAFAKLRIQDEELFKRLARCATRVPASDYTPQAIANIMNAYARHNVLDKELFRFLSAVSRKSVASQWLSRHLALVVNAHAKLNHRDDGLLAWVAQAVLARPASSFDVQAIANILNGYGKIYGHGTDRNLLTHMSGALCQIADATPRMLDPLSIASTLNAMVKTGYRDDGRRLVKKLSYVTMHVDPLLFDAQSVSTIMHSLAKLEWRDQKLFRRLATVVGQMEFILEPQSIALIINACAKVEYYDVQLMKHLSRVACSLPADTFTPQHTENVLNGFARLEIRDRKLFLRMADVVQTFPAEDFDSQAVAIIMNSFARAMPQDAATARVFRYLSHEVLPHLATLDLQATSLSIILNAFAKAEIRDDEAIAWLCSMIVVEDGVLLSGGTGGIPVEQFDGRHIASMLHAVATLHVEPPRVLDELLNHLVRFKAEDQAAEEVAIIAWSVAVLDLKRVDVYDWLMRALDQHITSLEANFRRQVHQFLLTCELNGFPAHDASSRDALRSRGVMSLNKWREEESVGNDAKSCVDKDRRLRYQDEVRADYGTTAGNHRSSRLQRDVALILAEMRIGFEEEFVDEKSGYSVDIMLSDKRTAIEVDGPSHYAAGSRRRLGNTNMKHRHLAQLGFDLRILPYWEWDRLSSKQEKKEYIRQLLTPTPSPSVA